MRLQRPRTRRQWAGALVGAAAVFGALFWFIAPYNIAASIPHFPGVSALLHGYMHNAARTWSLGTEPPDDIDLDDPALIALGAGHFETGCAPCHGAPGRSRNPIPLAMRPNPTDLAEAVPYFDAAELYWIARNGLKYTGMPAWVAQRRHEEPWAVAAFLQRYPQLDAAGYLALAYGEVTPEGELAGSPAIAFGGLTARVEDVAQNCARCHGVDGLGRDGVAPKLAGQSAVYLEAVLEAYATGERQSGFMQPIAAALSPQERTRLAAYFADLRPGEREIGDGELAPSAMPGRPDPQLLAAGAALASRGEEARDVPSCLACHGPRAAPERREIYPHIAGQHRRWIATWLRLWRERRRGGTPFANVMHEAARPLTDAHIEALATFFAAGAPPPPAEVHAR